MPDYYEYITIVAGFGNKEQKQFKHRDLFYCCKEILKYGAVMKSGYPKSQHIMIIILLFTITFFLLNLLVLPTPA